MAHQIIPHSRAAIWRAFLYECISLVLNRSRLSSFTQCLLLQHISVSINKPKIEEVKKWLASCTIEPLLYGSDFLFLFFFWLSLENWIAFCYLSFKLFFKALRSAQVRDVKMLWLECPKCISTLFSFPQQPIGASRSHDSGWKNPALTCWGIFFSELVSIITLKIESNSCVHGVNTLESSACTYLRNLNLRFLCFTHFNIRL